MDIQGIQTPWGETAWRLEDVFVLLESYKENATIVLGGDILTTELVYTYANWFYNVEPKLDRADNSKKSYAVAVAYLRDYTKRFGYDGLAVLVIRE